VTAAAGSAE